MFARFSVLIVVVLNFFGVANLYAQSYLDDYLYGDGQSGVPEDVAGIHWGHGLALEVLGLAQQKQAIGTDQLTAVHQISPWYDYRVQAEVPVSQLHLSMIAAFSSGVSRLVEFDDADNWLKVKQRHWLLGVKYYFNSSNGVIPFVSLGLLKQTNSFKPSDTGLPSGISSFTAHDDARSGPVFGFGAHLMMTENSDFVVGAQLDGLDKMHPLPGHPDSSLELSHFRFFAGVSIHAGTLND